MKAVLLVSLLVTQNIGQILPSPKQGLIEMRWRPGQEASLVPPHVRI